MIRKDNVLEVEHLGGGKGTAYVHHIVSKEELLGHGRLYAKAPAMVVAMAMTTLMITLQTLVFFFSLI